VSRSKLSDVGKAASTALRFRLPAVPLSVRQARRYVRAYLGFAPAVAGQVELALSEAVANAVTYAYPGGEGEIEVVMRLRHDRVEVVVRDQGVGPVAQRDIGGRGFGLLLMRALSDRLEIRAVPGKGTTVRMKFALAGSSA
jgi:anti-sigma regulatory factor (Ser/Thr protein kinase)